MIKTLVITDYQDNIGIKNMFYKELSSVGLNSIIEFTSLDHLKRNFDALPNGKYFIFLDIYTRFLDLSEIIKFVGRNSFRRVSILGRIFYFSKEDDRFEINKTTFFLKDKKDNDFLFDINTSPIALTKPKVDEVPRIILTTYHRDIYLRLTLNSLMASLKFCPEVPVSIILNDSPRDVLHVALEFASQYKQIEVLKTDKNAGFAALNVGLQWYKPKKFIMAEDDFILPSSVCHLYPIWPYQFYERLKYNEMVGWRASQDNIEYNSVIDWKIPQIDTHIGWFNFLPNTYPMMAQLLALDFDFWLKGYEPAAKMSFDTSMLKNAKNMSSPFLSGYHIGFNQNMDKYTLNKTGAFNLNMDSVKVTNLNTFEERAIVLNDIKNLK